MPGLVRKLLIFTTVEGLVLQAHGATEHHRAICIDFRSHKISHWNKSESHVPQDGPRLESHGVIGLIHIASLQFIVAITRREQVAQIYGKPIFVVTDVVLLPLSSQNDANEAILAAKAARPAEDGMSDSESSDLEDDHHSLTGLDIQSPSEEDPTAQQKKSGKTSIAHDVARRKAPYGQFASEWFSKRVWGERKALTTDQTDNLRSNLGGSDVEQPSSAQEAASNVARANSETPQETVEKDDVVTASNASTLSLLPKIVRSTKLILSSRSFYFSYDFDLTRRLSLLDGRPQTPSKKGLDDLYFWNRRMGSKFLDANHDAFLMPITQGFVGQRTFTVRSKRASGSDGKLLSSLPQDVAGEEPDAIREKAFLLTLISRRSTKRSGLRYLRRGIDDDGNCANSAETEQILSSPTWDKNTPIRSFVQVRGSIPLYFSQSPYSLKPVPIFHNSSAANQAAFKRHFEGLKDRYGNVQIAMLVNKHGTEAAIGEAYEKTFKSLTNDGQLSNLDFEWFDFHAECRGMKFENVERLVTKLKDHIHGWGETVVSQGQLVKRQEGIIRTNCMDCLDRTNVAQSAFGQCILQRDIEEEGYTIDLLHDESTNWFNTLWADNGDAVSRQYASTAALKGDFTRTRRRNWQGAVNDLGLTLSRYYSNMVNDYFSQAVIDMLLGNVSWKIFEDFESTMMSADPGISVASAREAAIEHCAKIVIPNQSEDLVHGWTLLSPAQENTLRTLPFEETVVLLTDAAVYCCKFDWNTEKVARFEKVDLRSISRIRFGTYITSTFTERQLDEKSNQGLVIVFTPGQGDMIRVNTRSLQNYVSPGSHTSSVDGGTGILSWFTPGTGKSDVRTMALKVINDESIGDSESTTKRSIESPHELAGRISEEIRRAIEGPESDGVKTDLVEEGDIISAAEARKRTGYLEQLGHSIRRLVWA